MNLQFHKLVPTHTLQDSQVHKLYTEYTSRLWRTERDGYNHSRLDTRPYLGGKTSCPVYNKHARLPGVAVGGVGQWGYNKIFDRPRQSCELLSLAADGEIEDVHITTTGDCYNALSNMLSAWRWTFMRSAGGSIT